MEGVDSLCLWQRAQEVPFLSRIEWSSAEGCLYDWGRTGLSELSNRLSVDDLWRRPREPLCDGLGRAEPDVELKETNFNPNSSQGIVVCRIRE